MADKNNTFAKIFEIERRQILVERIYSENIYSIRIKTVTSEGLNIEATMSEMIDAEGANKLLNGFIL